MKHSVAHLLLLLCGIVIATVDGRPTFDKIAEAVVNAVYDDVVGYQGHPHNYYHGGGGGGGYHQGYHQSGAVGGYYEEEGYGYGAHNGYGGRQPYGPAVRPPPQGPYYPNVRPPPGSYGGYPSHVTVGGDYAYGQHGRPYGGGYRQHGY